MEISRSQVGTAIQFAVQANVLAQMKTQGAGLVSLIASAPSPQGSVNLPGQGMHLDARV
jgi:hypothetical protein